jgi:dTMP kinase
VARRGYFIVFEGGDGAGKSTQSARLAAWLVEQGYPVRTTFEPGDTAVGAAVRQLVLHAPLPISARAEARLYAADKAQHVTEVVRPALADGQIVVCDRYVDSTIAYQGAGRALRGEDITGLAWWSVDNLVPDLTILMDVAVDQGLAVKDSPDRIESAGQWFHERVRRHFLDLAGADPGRYLVVDGRGPKDEVSAQIRRRVGELIGHRQPD